MTESEAKGFVQGKLDCMKKCNVFEREHSYNTDLCDNCEYCYSQGNFCNQKEAFQMAINALEKQIAKKPDRWESGYACCCSCKRGIVREDNYCCYCGQKLDWSDEE